MYPDAASLDPGRAVLTAIRLAGAPERWLRSKGPLEMITGAQIREARKLLGWSPLKLAVATVPRAAILGSVLAVLHPRDASVV